MASLNIGDLFAMNEKEKIIRGLFILWRANLHTHTIFNNPEIQKIEYELKNSLSLEEYSTVHACVRTLIKSS